MKLDPQYLNKYYKYKFKYLYLLTLLGSAGDYTEKI